MQTPDIEYDRDERTNFVRVPLDDATFAWLLEIAEMSHAAPADVVSAMLGDIRRDDQDAHVFADHAMAPALN